MIRRLRAQAVFSAAFMGLVLVGISACGSSSSSGGGGGSSNTPGLPDGHMRPLLADNGFSEITTAQRAAHDQQELATENDPLFESGEGDVTQGSASTDDRVYLTFDSQTGAATNVSIDVGNDGNDSTNTTDLTVGSPMVVAMPADGDRRGMLGMSATDLDDPLWGYGTRSFEIATTPAAAGDFTVHLVDWSAATDNYVGGGVWWRRGATGVAAVGAFVDGGTPTLAADVRAAGSATYNGHSYGRYTVLPAPFDADGDAESQAGFFAAKATLTADFGAATIEGTIDEFLFSTGNGFTSGQESELEDVIGGAGADRLSITLASTSISSTDGTYAGDTSGRLEVGAEVAAGAEQPRLDLTGEWGGRFYGTPEPDDVPLTAAGTWGAEGETGTSDANRFALSLIGSFGAAPTDIMAPPATLTFGTTAHANHAKYVAATGNPLLFADGQATASSVTQGSVLGDHDGDGGTTPERTIDRVYVAIDLTTGVPLDALGVLIDVGNDVGSTSPAPVTDLMGNGMEDDAPASGTPDLRETMLGTADDATDPEWAYTTRSYTAGTDGTPAAGDIAVTLVDWNMGGLNDYFGGGVWSRVFDSDTGAGTTLVTEVGAFIDGSDPVGAADVLALTGTATYRGHAYGRYSLNNAPLDGATPTPADEANPGYFAAKAMLNVDFGTGTTGPTVGGTISGTISEFLFSEDNLFTAASVLEAAIGGADGLTIMLSGGTISDTANSFEGETSSNSIRLGTERLTLSGNWGGRFYERGSILTQGRPELVGGTFGAAGAAGGTNDDDVGFSLIGAFGARYDSVVDLGGLTFGTTANDDHTKYADAAAATLLFVDGASTPMQVSSVTQGSSTGGATTDRVSLTLTSNLPTALTAVSIDVGNDGTGVSATADLTSAANAADAAPATTDLRTTMLGTADDVDDPEWDYETRTATSGTDNAMTDDFTVNYVNWAVEADGSYLGGGVWVRATGTASMAATGLEVGAFVDGGTPTLTATVNAATGTATYRGHAYGRYSFNENLEDGATSPADEDNPGYFAAKTYLRANFLETPSDANGAGTISGRIHSFLFSEDNDFEAGDTSVLEAAIGGENGLLITLSGTISNTVNSFTGMTRSNGILSGTDRFALTGNWGGRFYGDPTAISRNRPQLVGGTFGAAGGITGGRGLSLIGAFGAIYDTSVDLSGLNFAGAADANHVRYSTAASNWVLFDVGSTASSRVPGDANYSSVTQGSVRETIGASNVPADDNRTNDAVYLTLGGSAGARTLDDVQIDVGNDAATTMDLMSTTTSPIIVTAHVAADQRAAIGWGYGTHEIERVDPSGTNAGVLNDSGEFKVYAVDWTLLDSSNYMAGGVWVRTSDGTDREVGAFVDGEDPTEDSEITAVTDMMATYNGHAFGRYSFGVNGTLTDAGEGIRDGALEADDEANPGFFAARATLTARFTSSDDTISGVVSDFRFSETAAFLEADLSALDAVAGGPDGLVIELQDAPITSADDTNSFEGATASNIIGGIDLTGRWGGRFYGSPSSGAAPAAVGGTFGATGDNGLNSQSFSIIGAFGATTP